MDLDPSIEPLGGTETRGFFDVTAFIESVRPAWMNRSACYHHPEVDFFPGQGDSLRAAREICKVCPVEGECGEYALANPKLRGVWAGMSERDRRAIHRQRHQGTV